MTQAPRQVHPQPGRIVARGPRRYGYNADMDTTDVTTFAGFPPDSLPLLRDLRTADRTTFAAQRARYRAAYDAPAKALVSALATRLPDLAADLQADPVVGGSIFRVTRDARFLRQGEGPYKDFIDLWFWEGDRALAPGGLYLRITPEVVRTAVGARTFSREGLARYRRAVQDPAVGAALAAVVEQLEGTGIRVGGETLRGLPRGVADVEPADPRAPLLRHTALVAEVDDPATEDLVGTARLVDHAIKRWRAALPLHRWLVAHVQA